MNTKQLGSHPSPVIQHSSLLLLAMLLAAPSSFASGDQAAAPDVEDKPKVAVFPLGGDADPTLRDKASFAIRSKLDRQGTYEAVSGVEMNELVEGREKPLSLDTPVDEIRKLAKGVNAELMVWGDLSAVPDKPGSSKLVCNLFDVMQPDPLPRRIERTIVRPTDLRFVAEAVVEALPDVSAFSHPTEEPLQRDAESERLWKSNPNLVSNGDFSRPNDWEGILGPERYPVKRSEWAPTPDKVVMYKPPPQEGADVNIILAMNLSRGTAETYGLACLSAPIPIEPDTRYRLSFRYYSQGPQCLTFVKGYRTVKNAANEETEREVYRRQVPEVGPTNGKWVTVECDLNPQNVANNVERLRIDLYAYLRPGNIQFDDIVLKKVGKPTRRAVDAAIKPPASRPASRPAK